MIQDFTLSLPRGSNIELEIHGDTPDTNSRRPLDFSFDMQDGSGRIAGVNISIFDPTIRGETDFLHGRVTKGLRSREKNKITTLGGAVNPASIHYVPMVATHFGGLGPATITLLKELARGWAGGDRHQYNYLLRHYKQTLSLSIQVHHASLVLSKCDKAARYLFVHPPDPSVSMYPHPDTGYLLRNYESEHSPIARHSRWGPPLATVHSVVGRSSRCGPSTISVC